MTGFVSDKAPATIVQSIGVAVTPLPKQKKEGKKEGRKEGGQEGRKAGRKKAKKEK
jgi:hypothetical protein